MKYRSSLKLRLKKFCLALALLALLPPVAAAAEELLADEGKGQFFYPEPDDQPALSYHYARVQAEEGVPVYENPGESEQGVPPIRVIPKGFVGVSIADDYPVLWKGEAWYRINEGEFVRADNLKFFKLPLFQGVVVPPYFDKSLAWLVFDARASRNPGEPPDPEAPEVPGQHLVVVYEIKEVDGAKWCRIGGGWWVEYRKVGLVRAAPRPEGVGRNEKWVEIDLFEQTLAAYEGDRMVFTTMISSGSDDYPTVKGLFRIWIKSRNSKMSGGANIGQYYYLEDVPWQMYFYQSYALHANYWHGYYGLPTSHGCINLSPKDAKWLFEWTMPRAGKGNWITASSREPGTWVWIH